MSGFTNPIIGGGNALIREEIKSPDYVAGVSGWRIAKDGSVEFNDATIRGELIVSDPDGSYVRVYDQDPGSGAVIEMGLPTAAGTTLTPASFESSLNASGTGNPGLVIKSATVDGSPFAILNMITNQPANLSQIIMSASETFIYGENYLSLFGGDEARVWFNTVTPCQFNVKGTNVTSTFEGDVVIDGNLSVGGIGSELVADFTGGAVVGVTPASVTGGVITLAANSRYKYDVRCAYNATTANDIAFNFTSSDTVNVTADRYILAPALGTATNIDTTMVAIRRALTTRQAVGGPNGVASNFTTYMEDGYVTNASSSAQTFQLQVSQNVVGGTTTLQSGTIYARRIS